MKKTYADPESFRSALEQRLRNATTNGIEFARKRQLLVFDRFLARISTAFGDAVTVKGGIALELRIERARTTRDVDLRMMGAPDAVLSKLQSAAQMRLDDFMVFEIQPDAEHPEITGDTVKYDGLRYRASCTIGTKPYGTPFGVDIAFGEPMIGQADVVVADDVLGFAGIEPAKLRLYPVETHLAEKLHAYTMPRPRPNTRVKDLPDIALLASAKPLDLVRLREAFAQTFTFRGTHTVPQELPAPLSAWVTPYAAMAKADGLPWATLEEVTTAASTFMNPILQNISVAHWDPTAWRWS